MSAPGNNYTFAVYHVEEVVDYRTLRVGVDLGLRCGTTVEVQIAHVKPIRSEEKQAAARAALEEAIAGKSLTLVTTKDGDAWLADVYVDGEPLSL